MSETTDTRAYDLDLALALRHYVAGAEEAARLGAYQTARDAMATGRGLLEVVADHQRALAIVLAGARSPEESAQWIEASGQLLAESLAPFEMAHRGFQAANEGLVRVNQELEGQIAERRHAEEQARLSREDAERANRAKSEFLSRMSHELRTPLNAILGFGQLLEMDGLDEERADSVQQILRGGRHLLDLINEVLDIARIESGRLSMSLEPIALAEALREALDLIGPLADNRRIGLRTEDPWPPDGYVRADRQRLKQVLLNLLSNAVKYNREGGTVALRCLQADGVVRVEVSDDGPGIRPELMERLFVPFDRLGAEGTSVEGTGLGLALSKGLVEAMGGTLAGRSAPGQGSTFCIELPLADALGTKGDGGDDRELVAAWAPTGTYTILCIEDNLANVKLIERALNRRPGLSLLSAMQGSLGMDLARQHKPDLILLDLHLPDVPGQEVLRRLQGDPRTLDIPVILISADATPGRIRDLLAAGARAYLTKPIDVSRFFAVVEEVLAERTPDTTT